MTKCVKVQFTEGDSARVEPIHNPAIKTAAELEAMGYVKNEYGNYVRPPENPDKVFMANVCAEVFPTVKELGRALQAYVNIFPHAAKSKKVNRALSQVESYINKGGAK